MSTKQAQDVEKGDLISHGKHEYEVIGTIEENVSTDEGTRTKIILEVVGTDTGDDATLRMNPDEDVDVVN